jgi:catechol 2,3-dioxygenase-like lactoylglutathione lyase family enzyme
MKVNSISGISSHVQDLSRTTEFYEGIGFRRGKEEEDRVTLYVNWFFMTFIAQDQVDDADLREEAEGSAMGAGQFIHIKVDDVQAFYEGLVSKGLEPAGAPEVRGGNREFLLRDPDGYKLVFFQKK